MNSCLLHLRSFSHWVSTHLQYLQPNNLTPKWLDTCWKKHGTTKEMYRFGDLTRWYEILQNQIKYTKTYKKNTAKQLLNDLKNMIYDIILSINYAWFINNQHLGHISLREARTHSDQSSIVLSQFSHQYLPERWNFKYFESHFTLYGWSEIFCLLKPTKNNINTRLLLNTF